MIPGARRKRTFTQRVWLWTLGVAALPFLLYLFGYLGGCRGGTMEGMRCDYLPDVIGDILLGVYLFAAFGGWFYWLAAIAVGPLLLMLLWLLRLTMPNDHDK